MSGIHRHDKRVVLVDTSMTTVISMKSLIRLASETDDGSDDDGTEAAIAITTTAAASRQE